MKNLFFSIIKLFLFWIILFYIQQISFLLITPNNININLNQILKTLWYGIYLNISTASYLTILPLLFIILAYSKIKPNFFLSIANSIIYFEIIICIIVGIIDIGIFYAWNTKFNSKALSYIFYPSELFRGINSAPLTILLFSFIIILTLTIIIFNKYLKLKTYDTTIKYHKLFITTSIILFLLIIGMRGGIQARPINKGWAYHSINQKLNYSAINSMWNFAEVLVNYENKTNQYIFFEDNIARQIVKDLHNYPKDNVYILQSLKPNIVLIIMESVSAENLISLGGNENIMPGLDSISKQGILFTDFYANGFRTEQGLIALLSGFPAQPANFTVIRDFNRFEKLPNLARILLNNGYNNNYYYSGNLNYANTKSYLYIGGFNKIIGEEQQWKKKTQWGAYDEELFDFHIKNACNDAQPFFSIIMTSTNHEPFEANVTKIFTNKGEENSYKNTSYYTDKCIINYLKQAQNQSWYNNTLFIITSDHAHSYPKKRSHNEPKRHHIPLILYGNVIKPEYKGLIINKTGAQVDFPATLLNQLNINADIFKWSKNLFDKNSPQFAFYTFDNGFGYITPNKFIIYDHNIKKVVTDINRNPLGQTDTNTITQGKAYLQTLINDFLNLKR